jgi:hypothetical protein
MKHLFILTLFFSTFSIYAQSGYVEPFKDHFFISAGVTNRSLNVVLSPRLNGITQFLRPIWYRPSVQNSIGIGVSFKDVGVSFGFKLSQNAIIKDREGVSKYFDLQVHSYGKRLGYDVYYQNYQGYFIENFNNLVNNFITRKQSEIRRDDITLQNFSANVFYISNPERFSYKAAFIHDERQIKSAGSFILTASLGYFKAKGDSSFIPPDNKVDFNPNGLFSENNFYTFAVSPGYAYTLVSRKGIYISLGVSGLVGLQYHEGQGQDLFEAGINYFLKGLARGSVGYDNRKWVIGASATTDIQGMNTKFVQYRTNNLGISLFLMYRIKTKWMEGKKSIFEKRKKTSD